MNATLNAQLEALIAALETVPESEQPGNGAYYLLSVAKAVGCDGVDAPMVADIWLLDSIESAAEEAGVPIPTRDQARAIYAKIDSEMDSNEGITWSTLEAAL
jgi:predicted RNA polymerase sigma factor